VCGLKTDVVISDARRSRTLGDDGANSRFTALSNDQEIKVGYALNYSDVIKLLSTWRSSNICDRNYVNGIRHFHLTRIACCCHVAS